MPNRQSAHREIDWYRYADFAVPIDTLTGGPLFS